MFRLFGSAWASRGQHAAGRGTPRAITAYTRQPSTFITPELEAFRQTCGSFVEREIRPNVNEWEQVGRCPRELYAAAGRADLLGLRYGTEFGGSGQDFLATCVLAEELAKSDSIGTAVALMAHAEFALAIIADEASAELQEAWMVPAIAGELVGAIGVSEPGTGSDVAALSTVARRDGEDWVISGEKTFISNGTQADFITLAVRTGDGPQGISLIVFPTDTEGFDVSHGLEKMGTRASDTGVLHFDQCRVPATNLIGKEGHGLRYILSHFGGERLVIASFAVGAMERMIGLGLDFARTRRVFGKPIANFQTWRHRFAEMVAQLEATRLLSYQAAHLLSTAHPTADVAVSIAKLRAASAVQFVAAEILQLHGGFGQIECSPVPRYYRDVAAFSIGAGTSEIMREIISRALLEPLDLDPH